MKNRRFLMDTVNIYGADNMDKRYFDKCHRRLKEWGAPLYGWYYADVIDVREDDSEASSCSISTWW